MRESVHLELYGYELPKEYIAQKPLDKRTDSRLMILGTDGGTKNDIFRNLPAYLEAGDTIVVNDTKVLPAKLVGTKSTGGKVEFLVFDRIGRNRPKGLIKGKVRESDSVRFGSHEGIVISRNDGVVELEFDSDIREIMETIGQLPLPPYIKSELEEQGRYQTVFADSEGSIAAPTAGLHFTPEILEELKAKGVNVAAVTLHINIGTFLPIESHLSAAQVPESYRIDEGTANTINKTKDSGQRLFVVGTSTYKCLESACDENGKVMPGDGKSSLFIAPPYNFRFKADAFLTNFHLPRSSVLLLTCAYAGRERILGAYGVAKRENYRFYSFGDSMLILGMGDGRV
jgi:S-adenosylmethionine:tRNA ribosyltransferase-isomerase